MFFSSSDTVPTPGLPGLWNHTVTSGSPGYRNYTSGSPGVYTKSPQDGRPGVASVSPITTGVPGIGPQGPTGQPGIVDTYSQCLILQAKI